MSPKPGISGFRAKNYPNQVLSGVLRVTFRRAAAATPGCPVVGLARVRVAEVGGEEFDEAAAGVRAARGDHRRHGGTGFGQDYDRKLVIIVVHGVFYNPKLTNNKGRYKSLKEENASHKPC